jgi:hypothetical protein
MPESEYVPTDTISKLADVDPVFAEVVGLLYGDAVDTREVYDIAKRGATTDRQKRERTQARVGLASNIVGLGAGAAGTAAALRDDRLKSGGKIARRLFEAGQKIPRVSPTVGRAGAIAAGGALGLQVANLVGDSVANRVLSRASKDKIKKALDEGVSQIVAARRAGVIDRPTAIEMGANLAASLEAEITKASVPQFVTRNATKAGRRATRLSPIHRANEKAAVAAGLARDAGQGKKYALRGTAVAAGGAGAALGFNQGRKKGRQDILTGAVTKSDEQVDYGFTGEISKVDGDKRLAFGWCSLSEIDGEPVVDLQNDWAPIEEIEKSAYAYVLNSRKGGDMHARDGDQPLHTSDLVESMIVTPDKLQQMGLSEEVAKSVPVGWWVGFKVNDDTQWQRVKNGERTGFSIHGKGNRVQKALS